MTIGQLMIDTGCKRIGGNISISQWIVPGVGLYVVKEHEDGRATIYSVEVTGTPKQLEEHMRRITGTKKRNAA
jgi:hypothetical protein